MPATTDPVTDLLNSAEAIVRMQPEKRDQSRKLEEIGSYVTTETVRSGYQRAQEWLIQRKRNPNALAILKIQEWLATQLSKMKPAQRKQHATLKAQIEAERA